MNSVFKRAMALSVILFFAAALAAFAGGTAEAGKTAGAKGPGTQFTWKTKDGTFVLSERIAKKAAAGEQLTFAISAIDPSSPYSKDVRMGVEQAIKDFGIKYRMIGPADQVPEKQISELETLIQADQIDGLAIGAWDANTITPIFKMAWDKGIPALAYAVDSPQSPRLAYIGPSHTVIGRLNAEALMKNHPAKTGKLAVFAAFPEGVYARGRFEGFYGALKAAGYNLTVVGPFELSLDMSKGYGVVENTFTANPDIQAVYVPDEFVQVPADYISRNNLKGKVFAIGVNDFPGVLNFVKEGIIKQTVGQNAPAHGYLPGKIMYEFIMKGATVPEVPEINLDQITPETVDAYIKSRQ